MVYAVSLFLIGLSGLLIDSHRRTWLAAQQDRQLQPEDRAFARSQYRRRMQTSAIIGILGAAIGALPLIPPEPLPFAGYAVLLVVACLAILLLAALDAWASRQHYVRMRNQQLAAQLKLAREFGRDDH